MYDEWITKNVSNPLGKCKEYAHAMATWFPELKVIRGHYLCPVWGRRCHWWCVAPCGDVIDPTAAQFPSRGIGEYVPWPEGAPEPVGHCLECGVEVFDIRQMPFRCEECGAMFSATFKVR